MPSYSLLRTSILLFVSSPNGIGKKRKELQLMIPSVKSSTWSLLNMILFTVYFIFIHDHPLAKEKVLNSSL